MTDWITRYWSRWKYTTTSVFVLILTAGGVMIFVRHTPLWEAALPLIFFIVFVIWAVRQ